MKSRYTLVEVLKWIGNTQTLIKIIKMYENTKQLRFIVRLDGLDEIDLIEHIENITVEYDNDVKNDRKLKNMLELVQEMKESNFIETPTEEELNNSLYYIQDAIDLKYLDFIIDYLKNTLQFIISEDVEEENKDTSEEVYVETEIDFEDEEVQEVHDPEVAAKSEEWFLLINNKYKSVEKIELNDLKMRELPKEEYSLDSVENLSNYKEFDILLHYDEQEYFKNLIKDELIPKVTVEKYLNYLKTINEYVYRNYLI